MDRLRTEVDGRVVSWLRLGPKRDTPVIVLHGGGLDRAGCSWGPLLPRLAARHEVIAPDLPGHGESAALTGPFRVRDVGAWLMAFMEARGIERASVTGVSLGGATALWLALERPERVAAVAPVSSYGLARRAPLHPIAFAGTRLPINSMARRLIAQSDRAAREAISRVIHDPARITPELIAELREIAAETTSAQSFDRFLGHEIEAEALHTCFLDRLHELKPPALFIHGRHDAAIPISAARIAARAAGARLVEIEAGHWPMFEAPEETFAALGPFLARHSV